MRQTYVGYTQFCTKNELVRSLDTHKCLTTQMSYHINVRPVACALTRTVDRPQISPQQPILVRVPYLVPTVTVETPLERGFVEKLPESGKFYHPHMSYCLTVRQVPFAYFHRHHPITIW